MEFNYTVTELAIYRRRVAGALYLEKIALAHSFLNIFAFDH